MGKLMRLLWLVPYGLIFLTVQWLGLPQTEAYVLTLALLTVYWLALILCAKRNNRASAYGICPIKLRSRRDCAMLLPLLLLPILNIVVLGAPKLTALTAVYIVYIAIGEEFFFRGFLLEVLRDKCGVFAGAVLSALLFALMHCFNGVSAVQLVCAAGVGFALAAARYLTGSLAVPVIVHSCINLTGWQTPIAGHTALHISAAAVYAAVGYTMLRKCK